MWGSGPWHLLDGGTQPLRVEGGAASSSRQGPTRSGPSDPRKSYARSSLQALFRNARSAAGAAPGPGPWPPPGSDALEHLAFHDEGARVAQQDPEGGGRGQRPVHPPPADQPAAAGRRVQGQAPDAGFLVAGDEEAVGLDLADSRAYLPKHQDLVAHLQLLQLGEDAVGAWLAVVVDPVVAVPAGSAVAELDQPRPDLLGRGRDGDRSGGAGRVGDEVVAGHGPADLLISGAPAVLPGLDPAPVGSQNGQGSECADGQS